MASLAQEIERHRQATGGAKWRRRAGPFFMRTWLYRLGFDWDEEWTKLRDCGSQGADWGAPVRKRLLWLFIPLTPWLSGRAKFRDRSR